MSENSVEQLAAMMMALELPPTSATLSPETLGIICTAIVNQAKSAVTTPWIPVSERLPDVGKQVLMFTDAGIMQGSYELKVDDAPDDMGCDAGFMGCDGFTYPSRTFGNPAYYCEAHNQPSHWQPLPPPPQ